MMSTIRFMNTKMTATRMTMPWTAGKSLFSTQSTAYLPMPGQLKTVSVSRAPPSRLPNCRPMTVVTGSIALRSACLMYTEPLERPLARAVRT